MCYKTGQFYLLLTQDSHFVFMNRLALRIHHPNQPSWRRETSDERETAEPGELGRRAARPRARARMQGEARRSGRPLRVLVLDRHARGAEDEAGAAGRLREPVHGQGAAVRGAFGLVRAGAHAGRLRSGPGARSRHPGHLPLGSCLRVDVRGPVVGGRPLQPVPPTRAQAHRARCRGEGLRGIRGHRARVHRHALARRDGQPNGSRRGSHEPSHRRSGSSR